MTLAIDFETDWSAGYSVKDLGTWAYVRDPRFRAHTVSAVGDDGFEWVGDPKQAPWAKFLQYRTWVSHNAWFDSQVYGQVIPTGHRPDAWHCTADLMGYLQYPRALKDAVGWAFGHVLDKSMRERMKGGDLFAPPQVEVDAYALEDARWCLKLWQTYSPRWPAHEQALSIHTRMMAARGIGFDQDAARKALEVLAKARRREESEIPWVEYGQPPTSRNALFTHCDDAGVPRPETTAEKDPRWQQWLEANEKSVPFVRSLNRWRKLNRTHAVVEAMLARTALDRLHAPLRYYGAAITGRWSGTDGLNMQNLNSRDAGGGVDLRALLKPAPGHVFVISDLAQIEPRVLAVLSGDTELLDKVRQGFGLYEAHARATMTWDGGELKTENPMLYKLAKARVLGLGYGCGADKFVLVAKIMAGLDLTPEAAKDYVDEFRATNPRIVDLWDRMGRALRRCDKNVWCTQTKAGRVLRYYDPEEGHAKPYKGSLPSKFHGAKLVENLVQGTARDVLADMVLRIEASCVPVVMHVHDEIIAEVPADEAEAALSIITRQMSTPPAWMPELPVACEARIAEVYGK
jgi:hypothetical protein